MKAGTENRRKTIMAGGLGVAGLIALVWIYNVVFGFGSTAAPPPAGKTIVAPVKGAPTTVGTRPGSPGRPELLPSGIAAGVEAQKLATVATSLDPTLHPEAMLRTESLVYTGSGRNIFSAVYTPLPGAVETVKVPKNLPPARTNVAPPVVNSGPVGPPPIPLKFFGTAKRSTGPLQAFLLSGDNVYLANPGDIVARRFKIEEIGRSYVKVTDLSNNNTQTLPLQLQ